ncbi:MAG: cytochrome c oxidase accessory protein CcoG [Nitrosomonadales bacterium]
MQQEVGAITALYQELASYPVNTGEKTVHAKRMPGFFRSLRTFTQMGLWLPLLMLPYLRWNGRQAILIDIDHSQFHGFNLTVRPDEIWMLMLLSLGGSVLMFMVTNIASRVWCGYFCFQSTWVDLFTWIEGKVEGTPSARRKLDEAPWNADKILRKVFKHAIWFGVSLFTAISFSIWFVDAFEYWTKLIHLQLPRAGWITLALIMTATYLYAGLMREQMCQWMCPYARFQSVMADGQTVMPIYDFNRGEPRGKLRKGDETLAKQGDCIDCYQCVQVCPTGVDIRQGHQLGCITCGLCIDACNSVMDKIDKPRGLIRYASPDEIEGKPVRMRFQNPLLWVNAAILLASFLGVLYGLTHMSSLTLNVRPERQPLFVRMSDGAIQNRYEFKLMNRTSRDIRIMVTAEGGIKDQLIFGSEKPIAVPHERGVSFTVFVKAPVQNIAMAVTPIQFHVKSLGDPTVSADYSTLFNAPSR